MATRSLLLAGAGDRLRDRSRLACSRRRHRHRRHRRLGLGQPVAHPRRHQQGFFAEKDVRIDIVFVQSSAATMQQLTAGSLDITMSTGLVDPIRAIDKGAPLAIVRFEAQSPPYALVAKPAIKSMRDLKGKIISSGGAKDITRIYVERMLAPSGVKPGEFDLVFAGATSARARRCSPARSTPRSCCRRSTSRPWRRASRARPDRDFAPELPFSGTVVGPRLGEQPQGASDAAP